MTKTGIWRINFHFDSLLKQSIKQQNLHMAYILNKIILSNKIIILKEAILPGLYMINGYDFWQCNKSIIANKHNEQLTINSIT